MSPGITGIKALNQIADKKDDGENSPLNSLIDSLHDGIDQRLGKQKSFNGVVRGGAATSLSNLFQGMELNPNRYEMKSDFAYNENQNQNILNSWREERGKDRSTSLNNDLDPGMRGR